MAQNAARNGVPQCTLRNYQEDFADRHTLHGVVTRWARVKPDVVAFVNAATKQEVTWRLFDQTTTALAMQLLRMGFRKGDYLATSLPFLTEHVFLEYACFKIGVIHAPLDLRLKAPEVIRCLGLIKATGFAFLGKTPSADFRELGKAVQANCPSVQHLIQFSPPGEEVIPGAVAAGAVARDAQALAAEALRVGPEAGALREYLIANGSVNEEDGAQVIFTTGSTGYPKPALLSHRNITCQNMCLGAALHMTEDARMLVNLPPSHVGGQAEQFMTSLFYGGSIVVLPIFDPAQSLQAMQDYQINIIGQIPAMFNLEWRLPKYAEYDLSSLQTVLYGGQQVPRTFLERMLTMAKRAGTGLGLSETGGFCTYTPLDGTVDDILAGIGYDMPVYPMSIRQRMCDDGLAGDEVPDGEVGHICFRGPQTFLGYVADPAATAHTISRDGFLYTGDMGYKDSQGLHFAGRAKWVIKPKGYQVFPGQVEDYLCELRAKVGAAGVVGAEHEVFSEAIVAFVERRPGAELTINDLQRHAEGIASYMRPLHYVILEPGQLPLNRVAKTDYMRLAELAKEEIARLRAEGAWDQASIT